MIKGLALLVGTLAFFIALSPAARAGSGELFSGPILVRGPGTSGLTIEMIGDVNRDGLTDVILNHTYGLGCNPTGCQASRKRELLIGDREEVLKPQPYNDEVPVSIEYRWAWGSPHIRETDDFNGDGRQDTVMFSDSHIKVSIGQMDGSQIDAGEPYYVGSSTSYPDYLNNATQLIASDFNQDGHPDLIANTSLGVSVLLNKTSSFKGDLNGDRSIDVQDAAPILRFILGLQPPSDEQRELADVNADGILDIRDVVLLLQVVVGIRKDYANHLPTADGHYYFRFIYWKFIQPIGLTPLPPPEVHRDRTLTLISANNDIWQGVWEPYLGYQDGIFGDFTMQAKIESIPDCSDLSAAGLMVAQSVPDRILDPSRIPNWAAVLATRDYGTEAKWGGKGRSESSFPASIDGAMKPPYWVRVDRQGSTLSFFNSKEAKVWSAVGGPVDMMAKGWGLVDPILTGIVQQTHCGDVLGTAVVSHFQGGPLSQAGKLPGGG